MTDDSYATSMRIAAAPEAVFPYLTDPTLMVQWMGNWADLRPEPDGTFSVDINGMPVRGRYVSVEPPHRVVFTWGVPGHAVLPPGSTTVEITLRADGDATVVELIHRDLPPEEVAGYGFGWEHYLPRLAAVAAGDDPGIDDWATKTAP